MSLNAAVNILLLGSELQSWAIGRQRPKMAGTAVNYFYRCGSVEAVSWSEAPRRTM